MIEQEYLASRIASANDAQLVALLYEGLIDYLNESINCIKNTDYEKLNNMSNKSKDVISELISTLNGNSDIVNNYKSIYLYINKLITNGEIKKDIKSFQDAIKVILPLYEAWNELGEKIFKEEINKNSGPKLVTGMTYGRGYANDYVVNNDNRWEKG